jgi:hypothetical protein
MRINRWYALLTACAMAIGFSVSPVSATQKNAAPRTKPTQGPKTTGTTTTTHAPKTKTTSAGTTSRGPKTTATTTATTSTSTGGTSKKTSTTSTFVPDAGNAVAVQLSTKTNLMKKVQGILGDDVDLNLATKDFRNLGQFIAAVNVSNNNPNDIDFGELKALMTGTNLDGTPVTGDQKKLSLGQAIHELNGELDAEAEATKATTQANRETSGK